MYRYIPIRVYIYIYIGTYGSHFELFGCLLVLFGGRFRVIRFAVFGGSGRFPPAALTGETEVHHHHTLGNAPTHKRLDDSSSIFVWGQGPNHILDIP